MHLACQSGVWSAEACPEWSGDLNWLIPNAGSKICINGYGLGNAPTGDWYFIEVIRHVNGGNYYLTQRATAMTGPVGGVWVRGQQSGSPGSGWSSWIQPGTSGQYAFFNASSCPAGWVAANGTNGTVDLRGEFIRGWDNGRGTDPGRGLASWQGDAIRNITGFVNTANDGGSHYTMSSSWSGAFVNPGTSTKYDATTNNRITTGSFGIKFDASAIVPTAPDNRPRNAALLACMKL